MSTEAPRGDRRRGRPPRREQTSADLRRALAELLAESSFRDLTVDDIARRAGLTRSGFYFYFSDREELLAAVAEELYRELYREADRWWHGEGEPEVLVRSALEGVVGVYERHAHLLRAADELSGYDEQFRGLWRDLIQRFIDATTEHLEREQEAGRVRHVDPRGMAESLVWMAERCCFVYVGQRERSGAEVVDSLATTWSAALYPEAGAARPRG